MEQYAIKGGNPLVGEVEIGGAKNAALAILAAAIMTDETVVIENMPDVRDTNVMLQAIESIGGVIERVDRHTVKMSGRAIKDLVIEDDFIKKIRASYYLLGALLGKYKKAQVTLPGGCNIGLRPIDQHNVNGSSYRNHIHVNVASPKPLRLGYNKTMLNSDVRSQCAETLDMLVNGS